jgi:hypothetical protein
MNRMMLVLLLVSGICGSGICCGQTKQAAAGIVVPSLADSAGGSSEVQVDPLEFKQTETIAGVSTSPLMATVFQCADDGAVFLQFVNPRNLEETLYSVSGKDSVAFAPKAAAGLQDVEVIDYFPTDSMVAFLVRAVKMERESDSTGASRRKRHYFIAEFDRHGGFERAIQLQAEYPLFRFAALPSGEFLVAGYNSAMDSEQLLLLDDAGQVVRSIDEPLSSQERGARREASPLQRMVAGALSAGKVSFVGYKDGVLAWRSGTDDPVLEIRADGASREVSVAFPSGEVLADMLPSDDRWVIHVHSAAQADNVAHDLSSYTYYEVSPLDGSLLRKLTIANPRIGSMACKSRGTYIAFSMDKDKKLIELVAADR